MQQSALQHAPSNDRCGRNSQGHAPGQIQTPFGNSVPKHGYTSRSNQSGRNLMERPLPGQTNEGEQKRENEDRVDEIGPHIAVGNEPKADSRNQRRKRSMLVQQAQNVADQAPAFEPMPPRDRINEVSDIV